MLATTQLPEVQDMLDESSCTQCLLSTHAGHMQVLCMSRHVHTKLMKMGPQGSTGVEASLAQG